MDLGEGEGEKDWVVLTAGAVVSGSAVGTVFLTCLMETGPVVGVGFSLMAGSIAPSPHVRKGNFGKVVPLLMKKLGRMRVERVVFFGEWDWFVSRAGVGYK